MTQNNNSIVTGHTHSFDQGIAKTLGVNAAILFNHIVYWLRINASKNPELHEGKVWMYETLEQISDFFEYLTPREVKLAMDKLVEAGLIEKGNFNSNPFNRTNWYTVKDQSFINNKSKNSKNLFDMTVESNASNPEVKSDFTVRSNVYMNNSNTNKKNYNTTTIPPKDPDPILPKDGGGGFEEFIKYKDLQGQDLIISASEIYSRFLRKTEIPTEILKSAIQEVTNTLPTVSDIIKYLEGICRRMLNEINRKPVNNKPIKPDNRPPFHEGPVKKGIFV